jgi:predicted nucleic acid-binding Zn finger protein
MYLQILGEKKDYIYDANFVSCTFDRYFVLTYP